MPFSRTRRRRHAALLALAGLLATSGLASAAASRYRRPVTDAPAPPAATPAPAPTAPSGSRTLPDNPMRETAPGVYEGIVPFRLPDGSWQVDLDERFHQYSVARITDGGGITRACTHGAEGLARWRNAAGTASAAAACAHAHGTTTPVAAPAKPAPAKSGVAPKLTTPAGTKTATWEVR